MRFVLCMAVLTLATCDHEERGYGTGGGPRTLSSIRDAPSAWIGFARLRCDRMRSCDELGRHAKYDDYESCVATERSGLQIALPRARCAKLSAEHVRECAQAITGGDPPGRGPGLIGGSSCDTPLDDDSLVANVGACAADKLCVSDK